MKKQKLRTLTGFLLTGICLFCGNSVMAKSVTLTGSTGTNTTYIVVPPEYEGKKGEFVATATSTNKNTYDNGKVESDYRYKDSGTFQYKHGRCINYNEDGSVAKEEVYNKGKLQK